MLRPVPKGKYRDVRSDADHQTKRLKLCNLADLDLVHADA